MTEFIKTYNFDEEKPIYINVDKITFIMPIEETMAEIYVVDNEHIKVQESAESIIHKINLL